MMPVREWGRRGPGFLLELYSDTGLESPLMKLVERKTEEQSVFLFMF